MHLKCATDDIHENSQLCGGPNPKFLNINKQSNVQYNEINMSEEQKLEKRHIRKIRQLKFKLHNNDVSDKRSNCFWCTYPFDNPPIYIPKKERNGSIEVYGCFCSPECAVAYLKKSH